MSSPKNTKVKEAKADSKAKKEKKDSDKKEVLHVEKKKPADEPDIVTEAVRCCWALPLWSLAAALASESLQLPPPPPPLFHPHSPSIQAVEEPDVIAEPPPPPYVPPTRFERRLSVRPLGASSFAILLDPRSSRLVANTAITKQARHYVIGVRTGDRSYSSTEANVFCRLMVR